MFYRSYAPLNKLSSPLLQESKFNIKGVLQELCPSFLFLPLPLNKGKGDKGGWGLIEI